MNRRRKFVYNTSTSMIRQFVTVVCGFILPRLFLTRFGSGVNGLVSSVTQFLSIANVFDAGMGVVLQSYLFRPLAEGDEKRVNQILTSGQRFYYRIVLIFLAFVTGLALLYPLFVTDFSYLYTATLILAISLSTFGQYCFGVTNSVILEADQKGYINHLATTVTIILNTAVAAVLIRLGFSVQMVKLATSLVFLLRPLYLLLYVRRHYRINWREPYDRDPVTQKWNGFAQHVANIVNMNTDMVVLTIFSTLSQVSVYSVYFLVVHGIEMVVEATVNGTRALLGDMYARGEIRLLNEAFDKIEWAVHMEVILLYTVTAEVIVPFVMLYTRNVTDADYYAPLFAVLLCLAYCAYCIRMPYFAVIKSAGHFRQTQTSSVIEAVMNMGISLVMVWKLGIVGVALGTLAAMVYRTLYLVWYLTRNIMNRPMKKFWKCLAVDAVTVGLMAGVSFRFAHLCTDYAGWFLMSLRVGLLALAACLAVNLVCSRRHLQYVAQAAAGRLRRH